MLLPQTMYFIVSCTAGDIEIQCNVTVLNDYTSSTASVQFLPSKMQLFFPWILRLMLRA